MANATKLLNLLENADAVIVDCSELCYPEVLDIEGNDDPVIRFSADEYAGNWTDFSMNQLAEATVDGAGVVRLTGNNVFDEGRDSEEQDFSLQILMFKPVLPVDIA